MVANNKKPQNLIIKFVQPFAFIVVSLLGPLHFFIIFHCNLFQRFIYYQSHHSPGNLGPHRAEVWGREVIHKTVLKPFWVLWTFPFLIAVFIVSFAELSDSL